MKKGMILIFLLMVGFVYAQDFDLNNLLLKVSLNQGDNLIKGIQITGQPGETFIVDYYHLNGVRIEEDLFELGSDGQHTARVLFDSESAEPGIQVGRIKVASTETLVLVPVIFEVESQDVFYDIQLEIAPQYTDVQPGDNFVSDVNVFSLVGEGLGQKTVSVSYMLSDFYGNNYIEQTEDIIIENQVSLSKTFSIPANLEPGSYVFGVSVKYDSSLGSSSYPLTIGDPNVRGSPFEGSLNTEEIIFFSFLGLILLLFLVIVIVFIYMIRQRDKLLMKKLKK